MKKFHGFSIALLMIGVTSLASAAMLRLGVPFSKGDPAVTADPRFGTLQTASFVPTYPNYAGYDSTDVCAANSFPGRNNNLRTAINCPGFPGSGCYACDPPNNTPVVTSGIQSNAGIGSFQPAPGGLPANCNAYNLFQGTCDSNEGNYVCDPVIDQMMTCSGTYAPYDLQATVIGDASSPGNNRGSESSKDLIVVR